MLSILLPSYKIINCVAISIQTIFNYFTNHFAVILQNVLLPFHEIKILTLLLFYKQHIVFLLSYKLFYESSLQLFYHDVINRFITLLPFYKTANSFASIL